MSEWKPGMMSQFDVAVTLQNYVVKALHAQNLNQLKKIVDDVRHEFDMRKLRFVDNKSNDDECPV